MNVLLVVMANELRLAFVISMIMLMTSAVPVAEESGGLTHFLQVLSPSGNTFSMPNEDSDDPETYRQKKAKQGYISICWTETLIVTEDKKSKNKTVSKAYSIILDSASSSEENADKRGNTSCYKVEGEDDTKRERIFNFTTIKETEVFSIKEHKTLFCGAGPVLSEHFIVWPKLKRKQIEVSISPMASTNLRACNTDAVNDSIVSEPGQSSESVSDELGTNRPSVNFDLPNIQEYSESVLKQIEDNISSTNMELALNSTSLTKSADSLAELERTSINPSGFETEKNTESGIDRSSPRKIDISGKTLTNFSPAPETSPDNITKHPTVDNVKGSESRLQFPKGNTKQKGHRETIRSLAYPSTKALTNGPVFPQLNVGQIPGNISIKPLDASESLGSKSKSRKNTKGDQRTTSGRKHYLLTTENSAGLTTDQEEAETKEMMNTLLSRNINCTSENRSDICNEIMGKSGLLMEFRNNSSSTLANLFFPNNTIFHIFRDADNHSYFVKVKVVLELKEFNSNGKIEDEKGTSLKMEEESKYEIRITQG